MSLKDALLTAITQPKELRELLSNPNIIQKLELAGISILMYELHAPSVTAKKNTGLGNTLCGRARGMRNSLVTCKRCLSKLSKS